jgi:hypothetical protein
MSVYRCYVLDVGEHITAPPTEIIAETDAEALKQAVPLAKERTIEIWQGSRLVGVIEPPSS